MKIETKFSVGDIVYFMRENSLCSAIITCVEVTATANTVDKVGIRYKAKKINNSISWLDYEHLSEKIVFKTKQEVLNNIREEV